MARHYEEGVLHVTSLDEEQEPQIRKMKRGVYDRREGMEKNETIRKAGKMKRLVYYKGDIKDRKYKMFLTKK